MFVPIDLLKPSGRDGQTAHRDARTPGGVTRRRSRAGICPARPVESPAEKAGLKSGDILLAVGAERITKLEDFYGNLWKNSKPGDEVTLTVLQGGEVKKIVVKSIDRTEYVRAKTAV
jgi:S1-C subfamily serine protease